MPATPHRRPLLLFAVLASAPLLAACGSAKVVPQAARATPFVGQAVPAASIAPLLVTYAPTSPCAGVETSTDIGRVAPACRTAWQPYHVTSVPGQDLMRQVPAVPPVTAGPGVTQDVATLAASAYWRSQAFLWFALRTDQPVISDGLGRGLLYRQSSADVRLELEGGHAETPACHAFPTEIRVVNLAHDFATEQHRYGKALGVQVSFQGPCSVSGTDKAGHRVALHSLGWSDSYVIVGDVRSNEPFGVELVVSGVGQCSQAVVAATCAQ